ncbi:MAG: hypothetical protein AAGA92_01335 [Planctomycetota bacterium]
MTIPADGTTWPLVAHACAAIAAGIAACLLGLLAPRARGTTLLAPLLWAVAAFTFLASSEVWIAANVEDESSFGISLLRYAATAGLFTPIMALLGAKRPQDRGWQWIVASLWLVLVWPALQGLVTASAARVELFTAWRLFLGGLLCLAPLNYIPTQFRVAVLLATVGQAVLIYEWLAKGSASDSGSRTLVGTFLLLLAVAALRRGLTASNAKARHGHQPESAANRQTARWIAFRDAFGAFWSLRVMQRVNQTAELQNWPVRLEWAGFQAVSEPGAAHDHDTAGDHTVYQDRNSAVLAETKDQIDQTLDTLLRRFL